MPVGSGAEPSRHCGARQPCGRLGQRRELLKRDTLLQALTLVGDAFNNMEQAHSAMRYYNAALLRQPHNASVVSKMANILLGRKDYDGVLSLSNNYLAMDSLNIDILRIKGGPITSRANTNLPPPLSKR